MQFPKPKNWLAAPYILPTASALLAALATTVIVNHCLRTGGAGLTLPSLLLLGVIPLHIVALAVFLYKLAPAILQLGAARTLQFFPTTPPERPLALRLLRQLLIMFPLSIALTACVNLALHALGYTPTPQMLVQMLSDDDSNGAFVVLAFAAAAILAPVAEELLFRLGIHNALLAFFPHRHAMLMTAFIFAAMHGQWYTIPTLFVVGIFLQKAKEEGGLLQSMLLHALYNTTSLTLFLILLRLREYFPLNP